VGPSDYRGNMAAGMVLAGSNPNCPTQDESNPACCIYDNGVTYQNSQVNMGDITDGTTNTMLIDESLQGYWPDAWGCCVRTNIDRTVNKPIVVNVNGTIRILHLLDEQASQPGQLCQVQWQHRARHQSDQQTGPE
jgi:hypothetical protein